MAKNETRRIKPALLQEDKDALAGLSGLDGYQPSNPALTEAKLEAAAAAMAAAQADETRKEATAKAARDLANAKEWELHNLVLAAKDQVVAQFGRDSNEAQAMGLKK